MSTPPPLARRSFHGAEVVAAPRRGNLVLLDEVASQLLDQARAGADLVTLAARLRDDFGAPDDRAGEDAAALLEVFLDQGLVPRPGGEAEPAADASPELSESPAAGPEAEPAARPEAPPDLDLTLALGARRVRLRSWAPRLSRTFERVFGHLAAAATEAGPHSAEPAGDPDATVDVVPCEGVVQVQVDGALRLEDDRPRAVLGEVEWAIAEGFHPRDTWLGYVHAAGLAFGDRAVLFAGASHSGKSTLAAALDSSGCGLLSEDLVPLRRGDLAALPLPYAISVRDGGARALAAVYPQLEASPREVRSAEPVRYLAPDHAGPEAPVEGLPVVALVFPEYRPGASVRLEPLGPLDRLQALAAAGFRLEDLSRDEDLDAFLAWVDRTPGYRLVSSDLAAVVAALHAEFGGDPKQAAVRLLQGPWEGAVQHLARPHLEAAPDDPDWWTLQLTAARRAGDLDAAADAAARLEATTQDSIAGYLGAILAGRPAPFPRPREALWPAPFLLQPDGLPPSLAAKVRAAAAGADLEPSRIGSPGEGTSRVDAQLRRSHSAKPAPDLRAEALAFLEPQVAAVCAHLGEPTFQPTSADLSITLHGPGDRYSVHQDRPAPLPGRPSRRLAFVYYWFEPGCPFEGGDLLLYDGAEVEVWNQLAFTRVRPQDGLLIWFPADAFHEVSPVRAADPEAPARRWTFHGNLLGVVDPS